MKIRIVTAMVVVAIAAAFNFVQNSNGIAQADKYDGLYVFTDCKPVSEYEYLGTVKNSMGFGVNSTQYESVRDRLIKNAKKEYPNAEGIILNLKAGGTDKADVIKFKE